MFWVVDNFLMRKGRTKAKLEERGANQDSRNGSKVRYRRAASHEESESEVGPGPRAADLRMPLVSCLTPARGRETRLTVPSQSRPIPTVPWAFPRGRRWSPWGAGGFLLHPLSQWRKTGKGGAALFQGSWQGLMGLTVDL